MPYILNIETATKNCSVAISNDGRTIICREIATEGYSHAEKLHVFIEDVLQQANLSFSDLSAVAVSKGPGSYTGLRIGVSAAKGLCYALDIPLIAIDTLTILANKVAVPDGLIIPMLDARRMEVYSAIFNSDKEMIRDVEAEILTEESFNAVSEKIYVVGDCQQKVKTMLASANIFFIEDVIFPSAAEMGSLAYAKFEANDFVDVAYFEPFYLKDFLVGASKK